MFFIRFLDRNQKWLIRLLTMGITLTLITQLMYGFGLNFAKLTNVQSQTAAAGGENFSAEVNFELADANLQKQRVTLTVNGITKGSFATDSMHVLLHQGDVVAIQTDGASTAIHVVVDHDDPKLFYPAPGYTIAVDDKHPYTFQKVEFIQP